ncbi:HvB12D [Hordeum vulgare]|nr:HvB12D [Hordeum vulgare]
MGRAAGVLENHEEGRRYTEHGLRAYVQDKTCEIMPGINKFFAMYELFAMYREWQEEMAKEISGRQVVGLLTCLCMLQNWLRTSSILLRLSGHLWMRGKLLTNWEILSALRAPRSSLCPEA